MRAPKLFKLFKVIIFFNLLFLAVFIGSQIKTVDKKLWTMKIGRIFVNQKIENEINKNYNYKIKIPSKKEIIK